MLHNKLTPQQIQGIKFLANTEELNIVADVLIENYFLSWASTRPDDEQGRQHLYRMIQAVKGFVSMVQTLAINSDIDEFNKGEQADSTHQKENR